jgi:hypothetical protein
VCLPLGERHLLILLLVVRHRRCSLTLAIRIADGEPLHSGLLFLIESVVGIAVVSSYALTLTRKVP